MDLPTGVARALNLQPQLLIAEADRWAAQADLRSAKGTFLPHLALTATEERYVSSTAYSPVVVVGNTVLGGAQTKTAYGALTLQWNLWADGRDWAAYQGARAGVRAAAFETTHQLDQTLIGVLQAYAGLYQSEVTVRTAARRVSDLEAIERRSEQRYASGYGTTVAIGKNRTATFEAEQALNGDCQDAAGKSAALATAIGLPLNPLQRLAVASTEAPPPLQDPLGEAGALDGAVSANPAVEQARAQLAAARDGLRQAERSYGPTVSLSVQRDYLGQNPDSFGEANRHIAPADYRIDLEFTQPLFPLASESADLDRARAAERRALAAYRQAQLAAQSRVVAALSAYRQAGRAFSEAEAGRQDAERVLMLTVARYHAGRASLDDVQRARMDRDAAQAAVLTSATQRVVAEWQAALVTSPAGFAALVFRQLHLQLRVGQSPP